MSFRGIKGQDSAIECLESSILNNKVSHAYIFSGPSGVGKKMSAIGFAKALNCTAADGYKSCVSSGAPCSSCRKIDSSNHPDVFVVAGQKEGSSLGIDKVRDITKNVSLKPYEAKKKVYIIDGSENLTGEAQNAFLKTLEEPESDSVIIFIAEDAGDLLATIRSRAQIIRFFPLKPSDAEEVICKAAGLDKEKAGILARISSGSPGTALSMNQKKFFEKRQAILSGLSDGSFFDSDFEKTPRVEMKLYLDMILSWYRDVLVIKARGTGSSSVINLDRLEEIKTEASRRDYNFLNYAISQVILTRSFIDDNINAKLALGVLGANISQG